jgi:hypothetical protein
MWSLLYFLFILSVSYKYRSELVVYVLENMDYTRSLYRSAINKYHKQNGCPILEHINRDDVHYIKYSYDSNNYIMYLSDDEYNNKVVSGRLIPDFPYEIKERKKNLLDMGIQSAEDIIHAYVKDMENEVDVTEFCRMLSGPLGNFYSDNGSIMKVKVDIYKEDLSRWLNRKVVSYKITYIGCFGDEYYLDN